MGELVTPRQASLLDTVPAEPRARTKRDIAQSKSEQLHEKFRRDCGLHGLPAPIPEHQFAKAAMGRKWEFDWCFPTYKVAVEIEGLVVKRVWVADFEGESKQPIRANGRIVNLKDLEPQLVSMGRHANAEGFIEDCVKYNSAALLGWTVLRFHQNQIKSRDAVEMTVHVLTARGWRANEGKS